MAPRPVQNGEARVQRSRKGRKLTPEAVARIRVLRRTTDLSYREIGARFGVTKQMAQLAATGGTSWAHITDPPPVESSPKQKLSPETVARIRVLRRTTDLTYEEIGARFGVTGSAASMAATGKTWTHVTDPPPIES